MRDLVAIAQGSKKVIPRLKNRVPAAAERPEFKELRDCPTMHAVVEYINDHPSIRNCLAAEALGDQGDSPDMRVKTLREHADRLLHAGARFNKGRAISILRSSVK